MTRVYVAEVFGWMTVIEARTKRDALRTAKARASSASLLPSDVNVTHLRPASEADIAWFQGMSS